MTKPTRKHEGLRTTAKVVAWAVPVAVSVLAYVKSCNADKWVQSDKYASEAEAHRPLLVTDTCLTLDHIKITEASPTLIDGKPAMQVAVRVAGRLVAGNAGNAPARLLGAMVWDTVAGLPALRQELLDKRHPLKLVATREFDYGRDFVPPGDTLSFGLDRTLANPVSDSAVLHILLLYENESGKLFDSYIWAHVRNMRCRFVRTATGEQGIEASIPYPMGQSGQSYIYTSQEAKLVKSRFRL